MRAAARAAVVSPAAACGCSRRRDACVGLAAAMFLAGLPAPGFATPPEFQPARDTIADVMADDSLPSVVVAVSRGGKVLWEEGFGWADKEKKIRATEHTAYSLASISKPYTATALMVLVQRGKVSLDAPANDYLGAQKLVAHVGDARGATIRRLANHTSGLPLHYQFFYEDEPPARPSMDESIRRYGHLTRPPGEAYLYSNFGFGVLEYVVERVSGKPYDAFMREEVFQPLGMKESAVNRSPDLGAAAVAVRYGRNGAPLPFYDFDHRGASAVYASAHDLLRFGMFHLKDRVPGQERILSDANLDAMQVPTAIDDEDANGKGRRGIGWGMHTIHGLDTVSHMGSMGGVSTKLTLIPAHDIAIVVLTNVLTERVPDIEAAIIHTLLPQTIRNREGVTIPPAFVGRWAGAVHGYAGEVPVRLEIDAGGRVLTTVGAAAQFEVSRVSVAPNGSLSLADVPGDIRAPDAARYPYRLDFSLTPREDRLTGAVSAVSRPLADRIGNAMSYWVELRRER